MTSPLIINGTLDAPYFIFLRCVGRYSDKGLLRRFGLSSYRRAEAAPRLEHHAILADDGMWTVLADDWYYTLWHLKSTRPTLTALGRDYDVFACSVGDSDSSFDFVYYKDSYLVRKYVVTDPEYRGGIVVENFGEPLPGEAAAFKQSDQLSIVLGIATSLGIKTSYLERDLRIYAPPELAGQ